MTTIPFPDPKSQPDEAVLAKCIGTSFGSISKALDQLRQDHESITSSWKFSKTSGWYVTYDKGKQRLFYLFPKRGGFLLKIVFNDKGVQGIKQAALPAPVHAKLRVAKKYSEGTLLEFTAGEITPRVLIDLLRIKVASVTYVSKNDSGAP